MDQSFHQHNYTGRITLEYWERSSLASTPKPGELPECPDGRTTIEGFSVLAGWTGKHTVRIRGYVHPPLTGKYMFTSCGNVDIYLGATHLVSSSGQVLSTSKNRSDEVFLEAGTSYYVEAVCVADGDDYVMNVGWDMPDGAQIAVIAGAYLSPYNRFQEIPAEHTVLSGLSHKHPRVLATAYDFAVLRDRISQGGQMAAWYGLLKKKGLEFLEQSIPKYTHTDPYSANIAGRGNQLIQIMETLGFIHNIEIVDGDQDLARRCVDHAWSELEAASHFMHWNTAHFASTPRMAHAYAMGYDWFYNAFTVEQRALIRKAIIELGIKKYDEELDRGPFGLHQWTVMKGNWNCVINAETGLAILAVADENDYLAENVLHKLLVNTKNFSMQTYYPDGGTKESPSYWKFKDEFFLPLFPSLETALGTDFGLGAVKGFAESGLHPIYAMGPSGEFFNYSDGGPHWQATPGLLYLAKAFNNPLYAWIYRDRFSDTVTARSMLWDDSRGTEEALLSLPLDRYFSDAEVVYLRSAWDDAQSAWVGFAATDNWDFIHGQLDQGAFVFDALGQRWATELGADNYNLPGYWDKDTGGIRWKAYRIRAEGHNTLVINPGLHHEDQHPMAKGKMIDFSGEGEHPFAIADLTDAYKQNGALAVRRGVKLVNRSTLLICDELQLEVPSEVWWFMHTQADVVVGGDGRSATLRQVGKQVEVSLLDAPEGAKFILMPAERLASSPGPTPEELGAKEYQKLAVKLEGVTAFRLAVALMPEGGTAITSAQVSTLRSWGS
jgi:hypothetical protein